MFDWESFKKREFAVRCITDKEDFFEDCKEHGIMDFMGERAKQRDIFICRLCYKDACSSGRYELRAISEWQTKSKDFLGVESIPIYNICNI